MKLQTIRAYVVVLVAATCLPLTGLWVFTAWTQLDLRKETARTATRETARLIAASVSSFLTDTEHVLTGMSAASGEFLLDAASCGRELDEVVRLIPHYRGWWVTDTLGAPICARPRPDALPSQRGATWFDRVVAAGGFAAGSPDTGLASGEVVTAFAVPLRGVGGRTVGYLAASVSVDRFQTVLQTSSLPNETIITVGDGNRTVIARNRDAHRWIGRTLPEFEFSETVSALGRTTEARSLEGVSYVWAAERVPNTSWEIYAGLPANWALQRSLGLVAATLTFGTSFVAFVVFGAALVYRKVGHNLDQLMAGTILAAEGSARLREDGLAEVSAVARQMNATLTARDAAQAEVARLNVDLERRVVQRTEELQLANRELEAFAHSVSHDLRAPLRAIDGFSMLLLENPDVTLDDEARDGVFRVRAAAQRMGQLIDGLLELARVTRGEMTTESVNLTDLAHEVIHDLRRHEPDRRVNVLIAPNLLTTGDPRLLRSVLDNLIGNAWKFSSQRAVADIEVGIRKDRQATSGRSVYFIRDNGIGFDMEYVEKLFGAFQRLHQDEDFPGTGIGLATVHRIIARHGGTIWAESKPGAGATFFFSVETTFQS